MILYYGAIYIFFLFSYKTIKLNLNSIEKKNLV